MKALIILLTVLGACMPRQQDREFFEAFMDAGQRQFARTTLQEFLMTKIVVRDGKKFRLWTSEGHAYLAALNAKFARSKDLVIQKGAQLAISTWMIGRTFWMLDGQPLKAGFFFPDDESMKLFVQDRVDEMIDTSPYIKRSIEATDSTDNVKLKKYQQATLAFRATSTKKGVKTFDADIINLDEVDEHDVENLEFADDRLLHAAEPVRLAASQPSFEDFGINADYLTTNMHAWLIRCACGHWTDLVERFMSDPDSIFGKHKTAGIVYVCEKCGRTVNNQKGKFVARFPAVERDGVQISQLFRADMKPESVLQKFRNATTSVKLKRFYISIIGVPFSTADERPISQAILDANRGGHRIAEQSDSYTYMGADQGDTVHMVFAEPTRDARLRITGLLKCSVLDERLHHRWIESFRVFAGHVDAMPNKNWAVRMAMRYPDNIRIQYFQQKYAERTEAVPGDDEGVQVLQVNRDESLQDTVDAIKNGLFIFPSKSGLSGPDLALVEELELHIKNLIRERKEDENGKPVYQFKKKIANHFGMALNSLRLAYEAEGTPGEAPPPLFG